MIEVYDVFLENVLAWRSNSLFILSICHELYISCQSRREVLLVKISTVIQKQWKTMEKQTSMEILTPSSSPSIIFLVS